MNAFLGVFAVLLGGSAAQYVISPYSGYITPYASVLPYSYTPSITPLTVPVSSQYHSQDELGQFVFGHSSPGQAREETKTLDGTVRGSYSYVDPNGKVNQVAYRAGSDGFHIVGANNLPVAPQATLQPVQDTPEVVAARAEFAKKYEEAKEAALKAPEEVKSRRRRDTTEEKKEDKPVEATKLIFNPYLTADFYNPILIKSVAPAPIVSSYTIPVLGKTTIKTSELKPIEDSKVPASTKLAEIKEIEKEIIQPLPLPITYTAYPYSGLPVAYNSYPYTYTGYPYSYSPFAFRR